MISWPELLPLPLLDCSGWPLHVTLASRLDSPRIQRRMRYRASVVAVSVQWEFGIGEYEAFKTFFQDDLGNGVALFEIPLRYPQASALTLWRVRAPTSYDAQYQDGMWLVGSMLELITAVEEFMPSPRAGWTAFLVQPDGAPFIVVDDNLYSVKV